MSGQNPREIACRVLGRRAQGRFTEDVLEAALASTRLVGADRRLCQELVYGVVRWQSTLDWLIARKSRNRPPSLKLQNLLRLGLYQILWLERIPNHAAVHETVELAKSGGLGRQAGFVNAMLRGYLREFEATGHLLLELKAREPHLGYSHPEWLVKRWQDRWGLAKAAELMAWNNTPARTFARVNTLQAEPGSLLAQWRDENVEYDFVRREWLEENLVFELKAHPALERLASFRQGGFYVQDPSTLLAVRQLEPQPGEAVLDLCAAPGGKLTYAAQLMHNQGRLVAHDVAPERLALIEQNCARLGVTCVQTALPSALEAQLALEARFDRILVDAPCSNTGVMRRRVDLRWRLQAVELARLHHLQLKLLRRAARLLKPGGILVYTTCSLEPEENAEVVDEFLRAQPQFQLEYSRELLPFEEHVDGAFVARMTMGQ